LRRTVFLGPTPAESAERVSGTHTLRQLADNAGLEASVVVNKVRMAAKGQGLNVDTNEVEDLVKAGIIDPTMVTRSALQKSILMTEAIVAEPPEKAGAGMAGGMGDMGGMM
jgi:chaperonin GroEL